MDTIFLGLVLISAVLIFLAFRIKPKRKPVLDDSLRTEDETPPETEESPFYAEKVRLPRRMLAESLDGFIGMLIWVVPVFLASAFDGVIADIFARLSVFGMIAGMLYVVFRDSVGRGTSLGKRLLGLEIIDTEDGQAVSGAKVWSRNLVDVVPLVNTIDFIGVCIDEHGRKFMDRRLNTQLTEEEQSEGSETSS